MANNYAPATVYPTIPNNLLTEQEEEILASCGFSIEGDYVFSEEGFWETLEDLEIETNYNNVFEVFQSVIKRSKASEEEEDINEIVIEGAFYCSKMRAGEFGGYVVRILEDSFQSANTSDVLQFFRTGGQI